MRVKRLIGTLTALLLFLTGVRAQTPDEIMRNPDYIWAEGRTDAAALDGLIPKLSNIPGFPEEAVMETYRRDIRRIAMTLTRDRVIRYLTRAQADEIFRSRLQKIEELIQYADRAVTTGHLNEARTYYLWAETYAQSLPASYKAIRADIAGKMAVIGRSGGTADVPLRNIRSEVDEIAMALNPTPAQVPVTRDLAPSGTLKPKPARRPVLSPLAPGPEPGPVRLPVPDGSALYRPQVHQDQAGTDTQAHQTRKWLLAAADNSGRAGMLTGFAAAKSPVGVFLALRSDFNAPTAEAYLCQSDGKTDSGYFWADGQSRKNSACISAGVLMKILPSLDGFAGAGYGSYQVFWKDTSGQWAKVSDLSCKGLVLEAGLIYSFQRFSLGAGIGGTAFKRADLILMAGIRF